MTEKPTAKDLPLVLVGTKLHLPTPPPDSVERHALLERVVQPAGSRVSLVCAAAGFGKTTLAAQWAARAQARCAWLSLDPHDGDPLRFARYLVASLRGTLGGCMERSQGLTNDKQKVVSKLPLTANPELTKAIPAKPQTESLAGMTRETTASATGIAVEKSQAEPQTPTSTELNVNVAQAKPGESPAAATETASQGEKSVAASTGVAKSVSSQPQPAAAQTVAAMPDNRNTVKEQRDYREVHNVFIRHRSNINGIYMRAYEQDNSLQGRIVLELAIAASGKVEKVSIASSDLGSAVFQEELLDYIKRMSFESKNTDLYNITYPLDFLP